jgi:toxin ParE1/3/4
MKSAYTVRQSVVADLENIWLYTFEQWGADQADHYIRALIDRFSWLAKNPRAGKSRDDVKSGYYCFPEGQHIVFYLIGQEKIDIIGIPHQSMDIISYLDMTSTE